MQFYSGLFYVRESIEIQQCEAASSADALRIMLGLLPHDDCDDFTETDFKTITATCNGELIPEMSLVTGRENVWYWLDGSRFSVRIAYVVATSQP